MTTEDPDNPFAPPAASDLVAFRTLGGTLFATITAAAISSVEIRTIRDSLHEAIARAPEQFHTFVLDLERVEFINSEAISMFLTLHSAASNRGARLILAGVAKAMVEVFAVTHMQKVLTICTTSAQLDQALTRRPT